MSGPEYKQFQFGGVQYPLTGLDPTLGLLAIADPTIKLILDYLATGFQFYMGGALLAAATQCNATSIQSTVAYKLPADPEVGPRLEQLKFPCLCAWRVSGRYDFRTTQKRERIATVKVAYILPPLTAGQYERLTPVLRAVGDMVEYLTERGGDPSYNAGDTVWTTNSIARVLLKSEEYTVAPFTRDESLSFHAWIGELEVYEQSMPFSTGFNPYVDSSTVIADDSTTPGSPVIDVSVIHPQT